MRSGVSFGFGDTGSSGFGGEVRQRERIGRPAQSLHEPSLSVGGSSRLTPLTAMPSGVVEHALVVQETRP
jgi:hypothetical protein